MKKLIWTIVLIITGAASQAGAQVSDELRRSIVFVESFDKDGKSLHLGTGVLLKDSYVATNYHYIAGAAYVQIQKAGDDVQYRSDGYIGVAEDKDLIVLYARGIKGRTAILSKTTLSTDSSRIQVIENPSKRELSFKPARVRRPYVLNEFQLFEAESWDIEECTGGPVFYNDNLIGICVAGYYDRRYFTYVIPASHLRTLLSFSIIIKSFNSLEDLRPIRRSRMHDALMESLTSVLWLDFEDAVRLAKRKKKKILVDVYADWCGWCKLMYKNTYSNKDMIRYINENFISVRLHAEGRDSIRYQGKLFTYDPDVRSHQLAYSLLEGDMSYPSTVFLDEEINLLTVVPGYVEMNKMAVILRYFNENIYLDQTRSFEDYERSVTMGIRND